MEIEKVERVDHHGIVSGVIRDLGIIEMIDSFLGRHPGEKISAGEAVAGMIINGLGFTDRPMTLTPQFFENCPVELLFRNGVEASDFNRFKLGRTLEEIFDFGCDTLFAHIAKEACKKEGIETRFSHLDTTSFSLTGEYYKDSDEHAIKINHGYSKDHRPDLKQVVLEMLVTQEGGVPLISKSWDGNTSDNEIFNERTKALIECLKSSQSPTYLIADSKLYSLNNAENLKEIPFITRIPETILLTNETIKEAQEEKEDWKTLLEKGKYKDFLIEHYGISQRWIVVFSQAAHERAKTSTKKLVDKEKEKIKKELFHLRAEKFECIEDAKKQLYQKPKKWKYHQLDNINIEEHKKYMVRGRPKLNGSQPEKTLYQINADFKENEKNILSEIENRSCFVIGTNVKQSDLSAEEIIKNYKEQQQVERGFRFLKDPLFFTSSLFIKSPARIQGMLMVMTLALLVYSIAERRLRNALKKASETLPNQINKPVQNPTLRWVFQLLDGVCRIKTKINDVISYVWNGITQIRLKILSLFGPTVKAIYQIS